MRNYNTNSKVVNFQDLQPEQRRVYDLLLQNYGDWPNQCIDLITDDLLLTGSTSFFETPVTMENLPTNTEWSWRQSNARVSVKLDVSTFATMIKLNTKKKNSSGPKPPPYKFWIVQIERPYQQHLWFLHCEKGMSTLPVPNPTETVPTSISDLIDLLLPTEGTENELFPNEWFADNFSFAF